MASTIARCTASPIERRSAAGWPLTSEMRTSGMGRVRLVRDQPGEGEADQPADGLSALPARGGVQMGQAFVVVEFHDGSFQANDTAAVPPSEFRMAMPRRRSW